MPSVLIASSYVHPSRGGVEEHTAWLQDRFSARGWTVRVVSCVPEDAPTDLVVPSRNVPGTGMPLIAPIGRTRRQLRELVSSSDVVLVQGHVYPLSWYVATRARRAGVPAWVFTHTAEEAPPTAGLVRRALMQLDERVIARSTYRRAQPIGVSDVAAAFASEATGREVPYVRFPISGLPERRRPAPAAPGTPFRVVYVSRIAPEKRPLDVIAACERAHARGLDLQLDVYGTGPLDEALRGAAVHLSWVTVHGPRPHDEVVEQQADAHACITASSSEATQVALLEPLSMGVPCVATAVGAAPSFYTPELRPMLGEVGDVEGHANRLLALAADWPAWCDRFEARGRQLAHEHDPDIAFDHLLRLIEGNTG